MLCRSHDVSTVAALAIAGVLIVDSPAGAQPVPRVVAKVGDSAPGTPLGFSSLFAALPQNAPISIAPGTVAFEAFNPQGGWTESGSGIQPLFNFFQDGLLATQGMIGNAAGQFAISDALMRIRYRDGQSTQIVAQVGDPAPGTAGAVFDGFGLMSLSSRMSDAGELAFFADLEIGVGDTTDDSRDVGLWFFDSSTLGLVAREGDPAPGFDPSAPAACTRSSTPGDSDPRTPIVELPDFRRPVGVSRSGELFFEADVDCGPPLGEAAVVYAGRPGALRIVAMRGDTFEGLDVLSFLEGAMSPGGTVALIVAAIPNDFVLVDDGGSRSVIAREGDLIPAQSLARGAGGPGVPIDFFSGNAEIAVNDRGEVLFDVRLDDPASSTTDTAIVLGSPGSPLVTLAREGEPAPGTSGAVYGDMVTPITGFGAPAYAINAAGQIAFASELALGPGGTTSDDNAGLWTVGAAGVTSLVLRSGDLVTVAPGDARTVDAFTVALASTGKSGALGEDCSLAVSVTFDSGSAVVDVPGCPGDVVPVTTTTLAPPALCGDADDSGAVTATDALVALRAAVGTGSCEPCRCDSNGSGTITAADALAILKAATGQSVDLQCPAC